MQRHNIEKMTKDEKQAYEWALKQEYNSVAAKYSKILAKYIERMKDIKNEEE